MNGDGAYPGSRQDAAGRPVAIFTPPQFRWRRLFSSGLSHSFAETSDENTAAGPQEGCASLDAPPPFLPGNENRDVEATTAVMADRTPRTC
jgi:hypothetical protein